jgi:predicted nucleic acid-binding protein
MSQRQIYLETSVISYLTSRPSRDGVSAARQAMTHEWWETVDKATVYVSDLCVQEISDGHPDAAAKRLALVADLQRTPEHAETNVLAERLMESGVVPRTEPEDAAHIAIATLLEFKYLVTWNFSHFVRPDAKFKVFKMLSNWGYEPPFFATPEELLEGARA